VGPVFANAPQIAPRAKHAVAKNSAYYALQNAMAEEEKITSAHCVTWIRVLVVINNLCFVLCVIHRKLRDMD
jgi:hypothetical protein